MMKLLCVMGCMSCVWANVEEPLPVEAQAVVWRNTTSALFGWQCYLVLRNCSTETIEVPRSPPSYNVRVETNEGEERDSHYDAFTLGYPEGYVKIAPGKVTVYELDFAKNSLLPARPATVSVPVDVHISGNVNRCSVSCTVVVKEEDPKRTGKRNRNR